MSLLTRRPPGLCVAQVSALARTYFLWPGTRVDHGASFSHGKGRCHSRWLPCLGPS